MTPKTVVITGANSGIGRATAQALAAQGDHIVVIGRDYERTSQVAKALSADYLLADFADLNQVRRLAHDLSELLPRIDVLINNAGAIMGKRAVSADGFEMTFQVNHLAPFLLTNLLLDKLSTSHASVITVASSSAKRFGNLDIEDLQNTKKYTPEKAYGDSKLANILFTNELQRRYGHQGISATSVDPGNVATGFAADSTSWMRVIYHNRVITPIFKRLMLISPEQSAQRLVWLANGIPSQTWQTASFYEDRTIGQTTPQAFDVDLAARLWLASAEMVGM
ncbi:SDR family NAD(P)-dependent oxidoreductase [Quadrisphaera sp. KR29]|uniref:SDR family NAD(P)-dependent oxidoreductase n=1 Tax=Quadrisphaera sp. KR29 TaxID=3461391 RepID=UPI00404502C6